MMQKDDEEQRHKDALLASAPVSNQQAMRQSARGVLEDEIRRLEKRVHDLKIIRDRLPAQLDPEFDEAMWDLLLMTRRF